MRSVLIHPPAHLLGRVLATAATAALFAALVASPAPAGTTQASLVINEVSYVDDVPFVELHNPTSEGVDPGGLVLDQDEDDGILQQLPSFTIPAGGFAAICMNGASGPECATTLPQALHASGGNVVLQTFGSDVVDIDRVGWAGSANGEGTIPSGFTDPGTEKSLSRCPDGADTDVNVEDFRGTGRTPGAANSCPTLLVNEVDAAGASDFVEIRNPGTTPVALGDYFVDAGSARSFFAPGSTLAPGGLIVADIPIPDVDTLVAIRSLVSNQRLDAVGLDDQEGEGPPNFLQDPDNVPPATGAHGVSRCGPDTDINARDFYGLPITPGEPNACPSVLINEVDYDVGSGEVEFIEVVNTGSAAFDLFDAQVLIDNGEVLDALQFTERPTTLPAGGRITICLAQADNCDQVLIGGGISLDDEAGGLAMTSRWSLAGIDLLTWEGGGLLVDDEPGPSTTSLADPGAGMSLSRCPDSTPSSGTLAGFIVAAPTVDAANACEPPLDPPVLLINEVAHTGQEFIEIHNPTDAAVDLNGYDLIIDPPRQQVVLNGSIAAGGYRTICLNHTACDQNVAGSTLPDGPSGIALRDPERTVLDVLSWGDGGVPPDTQAEGGATTTLIDPGDPAGNSLSRCPDANDTDVNATDFSLQARSLGVVNPCTGPVVPEDAGMRVVTIPVTDATATSIAFSQLGYPDQAGTFAQAGPTEVLLASDSSFADALASGSLQASRPLLLNDKDALEPTVLAEIQRLGAATVRVLGGSAVIADTVVDQLQEAGLTVTRTFGPTRLETAEQIAQVAGPATSTLLSRAFPAPGGDDTQAFADSLAAGGWAAAARLPVLLTQTEVLSGTTNAYYTGSGVTAVQLIGGTSALGQPVVDGLGALGVATSRNAGATRFATAVAIATARGFTSSAPAATVIVVEGQAANAWEAGFTAGGAAAALSAPIVLANGDLLPQETQTFLATAVTPGTDQPALVCAAAQSACDAARTALGL